MEEPYGSELLPNHTRPRKWWNGWTPGPVECHQVLKGGQPGPLNSPDTLMATHGNSFFGGTWQWKCSNLSLECCLFWRGQLGVESCNIPEIKVQGSTRNRKKRVNHMVGASPPREHEGKHSVLSDGIQPSHHHLGLVWFDNRWLSYGSSWFGYPQGVHQTGKTVFSNSCL